jgi:S1-C subfamily serine protease
MRLSFLLLLSFFHSLTFSQKKNALKDSSIITGIYQVQLKENYNNKGELYYSTFFEGEIIISSTGDDLIAKKVKTNKPYFSITKTGATYQIIDKSEISIQEGSFTPELFSGEEIKLKLSSKDKDHIGWYSVYTLRRITTKELYKNISQGTGFFISSNGHILTNYHVVANSELVKISIAEKEYECETVSANEVDDIAIIRAKDSFLKCYPIPFTINNLDVGDDVIALGFPLASTIGNELKLSSGVVNSNKGFKDDPRYFQLSASIEPGNSGGPVLNRMGYIVGLITAKYTSATNIGYALNLYNILKNIPNYIKIKKEHPSQILSNSSIYSKYKSSIVLIKSYSL